MGCNSLPFFSPRRAKVRIGISGGTQTLWRYLVRKRETLLTPLRRDIELRTLNTEAELRQAFVDGQLDIAATLPPAVPSLAQSDIDAQFFLPVSWIREGFMFITGVESPVRSMSDLVGQSVAIYPLSHPGFAYWLAFLLKNYGISIQQMNYRETERPEASIQAAEVVAACVGSSQWSTLKMSQRYRKISDLSEEWRKISKSDELLMFGGYMARSGFIQDNRGFIDDFVGVNYDVLRAYKTDRNAFLEAISEEEAGPNLTREQNESIAWYLGLDDVDPGRMYISDRDVRSYEEVFTLLADAGYLRKPLPEVNTLFYRSQRR